eukprot:Hpha_TRINITY_DN35438_c0_g1::TRINITY_DN35438_c0_g1_i1::g.83352::m.83352
MSISSRATAPRVPVGEDFVAPPDYIWAHIVRLQPTDGIYVTPQEGGDGYICAAIAENRLSLHLFEKLLEGPPPPLSHSFGYANPAGDAPFRRAAAAFWSAHVSPERGQSRAIDPEHLITSAGVTACLEEVLFALTDPGDCVLLPAPCFAGYAPIVQGPRVAARIVPFGAASFERAPTDADAGISPAVLEAAAQGKRVRVLMLTSPTNPTGAVFSREALRGAVGWAVAKGVHVVVDEVYACSVHSPTDRPWCSILDALEGGEVDEAAVAAHVHV